jgi:hypothetical protein
MFAGLLLMLTLVMRLFPETPFVQILHNYLVLAPLRMLATAQRHHVILLFVLLALTLAPEAMALMGSTDVFMTFAWDLSLYLDALAVTYALAAYSHIKAAGHVLRRSLPRIGLRKTIARQRARRVRPVRRPANNDDDDGRGFALAA